MFQKIKNKSHEFDDEVLLQQFDPIIIEINLCYNQIERAKKLYVTFLKIRPIWFLRLLFECVVVFILLVFTL